MCVDYAGSLKELVDEILYHARVHPEERCSTLDDGQLQALHTQVAEVCRIAVEVNADDTQFPEDWLFKHRWVRMMYPWPTAAFDIPYRTRERRARSKS